MLESTRYLPRLESPVLKDRDVDPINHRNQAQSHLHDSRKLVSLIIPAYGEANIIEANLAILEQYMKSLENRYDWEMIVVNDGSKDATGELAEAFASTKNNVHVVHHPVNLGLGQALQSAFSHSKGEYLVTYDMDLSYAPSHIGRLLDAIDQTRAMIVVASPYMEGGKVNNVPWLRKTLSIWANRFLSLADKGYLATLTGMVRAYDGEFVKSLHLKSTGMEINPEIIQKARILNARIVEIPAHLSWRTHKVSKKGQRRKSSMKIFKHIWEIVFSGFLFRPVMFFFILPGLAFSLLSLYASTWALIHTLTNYQSLSQYGLEDRISFAVSQAFTQAPHTFVIGGISLMVAIQLISLGMLSLQNKSYFEEIFHFNTQLYRVINQNQGKYE